MTDLQTAVNDLLCALDSADAIDVADALMNARQQGASFDVPASVRASWKRIAALLNAERRAF